MFLTNSRAAAAYLWGAAILMSSLLASSLALADTDLISKHDAEKFCLQTWFPKLRMGHEPADEELKVSLTHLLDLYADDIEIIDPNSQDLVKANSFKGKVQVRDYYKIILKGYPLWTFKILEIYPNAKGFILRYEGQNAGPVKKFEGVDIIELKKAGANWKISKLIEYYDRLPFTEKASP